MVVTKTWVAAYLIGAFGVLSTFSGWLNNTSPAVIIGAVSGVLTGVMMALDKRKKWDLENQRTQIQIDAEQAKLHRQDCEDTVRILQAKVDKLSEENTSLRVRVGQWEAKYPTQPTSTITADTKTA